jgi:hypothetical protein
VNKDAPSHLQSLLEDLYEVKISFEEGQQGQKISALTQKKNDHEAVKAIQEAVIGWFSLSLSDYEDTDEDGRKKKQLKNDWATKQSCGSLKTLFITMCEALQDQNVISLQELVLKKELLKEQMNMKKFNLKHS